MELQRSSRHRFTSETSKYYINCDELPKEANSITNEQLITYNRQDDVEIYKALIDFSKYNKKNKHIVIKIGYKDKRIYHEFHIGTLLYKSKIPGFIKYICVLSCDDVEQSTTKGEHNNICTNRTNKEILLMPFIHGSAVANRKWSIEDINIIKSVLKQIILSCFHAFDTIGFIHNDLHMENVFMKSTTQSAIHYGELATATYGYKIVIMDFDKSFVNTTQNSEYNKQYTYKHWNDMERVFLEFSIVMLDNGLQIPTIYENIIPFIVIASIDEIDYKSSLDLLDMIDNITIVLRPKLQAPASYNPNIF